MTQIPDDLMAALNDDQGSQGYLKAGFLGFPKSGKSHTATLLAVAVQRQFKLDGPIGMFDTEAGSVYLKPLVRKLTGRDLLARRARSFDDLMRWADAMVRAGVQVGLVDSVTHPWRELCDSFLAQKNEFRQRKNWSPQEKLEFQDWNVIKPRWARWTDFYLNCPMHVIICGRAGFEYEYEVNEKGKKELVKTGVKMKTESEFGFEPSLLVEMERDQELGERTRIVRRATVLGDRFSLIDGRAAGFPSTDDHEKALKAVWAFFRPHLDALVPSAGVAAVDTDSKTAFAMNDDGDEAWQYEKKQRAILCEEVQGVLTSSHPGQSAPEKKIKSDLLEQFFGTRSWTKVEGTDSGKLRAGLKALREKLRPQGGPADDAPFGSRDPAVDDAALGGSEG